MQSVTVYKRKDFRDWLEKNHSKENRVALVSYKKHTGKHSISHKEAMEEAICFGWIDTTIKKLDEERFIRTFAKRSEKGRWSNATQSYAKDLIARGLMTTAGLEAYKRGLKLPVIDHGFPKNPETPEELKKALSKNKKADNFFNGLAPSYKRSYIYAVLRAKTKETIDKRIKIVVERCSENKKF